MVNGQLASAGTLDPSASSGSIGKRRTTHGLFESLQVSSAGHTLELPSLGIGPIQPQAFLSRLYEVHRPERGVFPYRTQLSNARLFWAMSMIDSELGSQFRELE